MKKILVVDDSKSIRDMASATLSKEGYTVTVVEDGKKALHLVKEQRFDLIFTDIYMPIMDGLEFTKAVRSLEQNQFTPILVLSCEDNFEIKKQGKQAGATGWLVKPIRTEQLINSVKRVI